MGEQQTALERIGESIVVLRGKKVLLDADLARLYGVTTKRFNEQIKRNASRFPSDFMFRLNDQDLTDLRSQIATSSPSAGWGGRRYRPLAFTEHGAVMAANVLDSRRATDISVYVVRAFIRLRDSLAAHGHLAKKLEELERKTAALALRHDELSASTHAQLKQVIETLRQLMAPIQQQPTKRPIGFITPKG
jgi:hypothetical protein